MKAMPMERWGQNHHLCQLELIKMQLLAFLHPTRMLPRQKVTGQIPRSEQVTGQ
uniref:Uncharacterized protein n=1 Tax=Rhizophora mucronata TaxID=61149 RepID=A0A2P2PLM6_RHIMU